MDTISARDYVNEHCSSADRILLINPLVTETRYQWIRWNQPLDLLKLSNFLKEEIGCQVKLFDFMLPDNGRVLRTVNRPDSEIEVNGYAYNLWRYGKSNEEFTKWFDRLKAKWPPTQIWVTSLTSYWWRGVRNTINLLKFKSPDIKVVLLGQYPTLAIKHAQEYSFADIFIDKSIDISEYPADFEVYEDHRPSFCALDVYSKGWHHEVINKFDADINDFVFFNDNILAPDNKLLERLELLQKELPKRPSNRRLKFHAICGLYPAFFSEKIARGMKDAGFVEFHFEPQMDGEELDLEAYREARQAYHNAGLESGCDVSTFLFIGLPSDDLERITRQMLNLFELFGSVILKPYTPTPGSATYNEYKSFLEKKKIEYLSPHLFPFSEVNGISHDDYEELYTLAAALNQRVKSKAFNSFPGTLAHEMIRTSLKREVWKLGS